MCVGSGSFLVRSELKGFGISVGGGIGGGVGFCMLLIYRDFCRGRRDCVL